MASGLLHYLGLFTVYTLLAIALIYGAYCYLRKHASGGMLSFGKKPPGSQAPLAVESVLTLEARKNLYVIRSGSERFLVATSLEGTQFLSRLEPESQAVAAVASSPDPVTLPFETAADRKPAALTPADPEANFSGRLMHSLRWLASSRIKLT